MSVARVTVTVYTQKRKPRKQGTMWGQKYHIIQCNKFDRGGGTQFT